MYLHVPEKRKEYDGNNTERYILLPKVFMQVKWHLWTYPTASLVVFLDMTLLHASPKVFIGILLPV